MTVNMTAVAQEVVAAAVAETKAWLRIETAQDDAALADACRSAIGMGEDFCAQRLFRRAGTETVRAGREWRRLTTCPVRAIGAVSRLSFDGVASLLPVGSYAVDIGADGDGWVRVMQADSGTGIGAGIGAGIGERVRVDLTAGIAESWEDLPDPLKQGIVRLAAHLFAENASEAPPAIVSALWRPWRRMRIA